MELLKGCSEILKISIRVLSENLSVPAMLQFFNRFVRNAPFLYPVKSPENRKVF